MTTTPETEDEQTASATRVPVELPGADTDHATALVLNAAIDVHLQHERLRSTGGDLTTSAEAHKAQNALHDAVRAYLPMVTRA